MKNKKMWKSWFCSCAK